MEVAYQHCKPPQTLSSAAAVSRLHAPRSSGRFLLPFYSCTLTRHAHGWGGRRSHPGHLAILQLQTLLNDPWIPPR
eukprot:2015690-Prymnesium_polylepis.1